MRILVLSAYDASSHRYWHKGLSQHLPEYDWTVLTLPDRYFSWRLRGNSLTWAMGKERKLLEQPWDRVIATSMVDLSSLRGMVPSLGNVPTTVYFHENQFAYPRSEQQTFSPVEPQLQSIYTALCAQHLIFNSEYNRSTFFRGATALLKKLPDHVPKGIVEHLSEKSNVIPVPLFEDSEIVSTDLIHQSPWKNRAVNAPSKTGNPTRIVWNARHEWDKGPDRLLAILRELNRRQFDFEIAVLGQQFRKSPEAFTAIQQELSHKLAHFGYMDSISDYRNTLASADIVLSTALHEFQGIAVLEAMHQGCTPILPNRQVYPEIAPEAYLYPHDEDVDKEAQGAADLIMKASILPPANTGSFSWNTLKEDYKTVILS